MRTKKIKIKKSLANVRAKLYLDKVGFIGYVNEHQYRDICVQIAGRKLTGYYVIWRSRRCEINKYGRCEDNLEGFTDLSYNLVKKLLTINNDR